jgi:hypothetical protein
MVPEVGASNPAMRRMSVVLPAPSGPTNPVIWPARKTAETLSNAGFFECGKIFRADSSVTRTSFMKGAGAVT